MILSYFPLTYTSKTLKQNASNNLLRIVIREGCPQFYAVLDQERFEWGYKWRNLHRLFYKRREFFETMEEKGHAIEIATAVRIYKEDANLKLEQELDDMLSPTSSYHAKGLWQNVSRDELRTRVRNQLGFLGLYL